jgi:hypothetical protein
MAITSQANGQNNFELTSGQRVILDFTPPDNLMPQPTAVLQNGDTILTAILQTSGRLNEDSAFISLSADPQIYSLLNSYNGLSIFIPTAGNPILLDVSFKNGELGFERIWLGPMIVAGQILILPQVLLADKNYLLIPWVNGELIGNYQ